MKNLFEESSCKEVVERINLLATNSTRLWGKMDVAQMMAHCSAGFEIAHGDRHRPRVLLGYLFGNWAKKKFVYDLKFKRNSPTDKTIVVNDSRDFETEKTRLLTHIERFRKNGPSGVTKGPHPFFGKMTPIEWAQLKYNHLNHHLRQFGV